MVKIRFLFLVLLFASLCSIKISTPVHISIPETPKIVENKPAPIIVPYEPPQEMPPLIFFYPPADLPLKMSFEEPIDYKIYGHDGNLCTDIGDILLLPPELILDAIIGTFDQLLGIRNNTNTVTSKILDFHVDPTRPHLFSTFTESLVKREMRYFGGFGDSYLNTPEVQAGTAQIQSDDLMDDQRKILWDVGKNTYLSKYRVKVDGIKDEAFYFTDWRGIDFAVLPPLVAGYLYYRGFEKKVSFFDTEAKLSIEPLRTWIEHDDLLIGAGIEWAPKGWPVKLLVAVGVEDGDIDLQFIGIGTSIGVVKQLLFRQEPLR